MSRSSELEVSELVAFLDLLALLKRLPLPVDQHAGRDLHHAHGNETHQADTAVVGFDEDERSGRHVGDKALRVGGTGGVELLRGCFGVVRSWYLLKLPYGARDRAVPTVIVLGAEERLVHGAIDELFDEVPIEHVPQGIGLRLHPESVVFLHLRLYAIGLGLAGVHDGLLIAESRDGPTLGLEAADEEVVPALETAELGVGIDLEFVQLN